MLINVYSTAQLQGNVHTCPEHISHVSQLCPSSGVAVNQVLLQLYNKVCACMETSHAHFGCVLLVFCTRLARIPDACVNGAELYRMYMVRIHRLYLFPEIQI